MIQSKQVNRLPVVSGLKLQEIPGSNEISRELLGFTLETNYHVITGGRGGQLRGGFVTLLLADSLHPAGSHRDGN